eukprot:8563402-Lingulodinium_polyedra.AAC.1
MLKAPRSTSSTPTWTLWSMRKSGYSCRRKPAELPKPSRSQKKKLGSTAGQWTRRPSTNRGRQRCTLRLPCGLS